MIDSSDTPAGLTPDLRRAVIELLNDAVSAEYHSFVGHVLISNPYLPPGTEKDMEVLERIRDEENVCTKALLVQLARYRAGPTIRAFRWWRSDLNFLGLDFLVVRAAEIAKAELARAEAAAARAPAEDPELRATFASVVASKRRHAEELGKLAAQRGKERQARRAAAFAATSIPLKKPAAAAAPAAKPAGGAPAAPGAPKLPGAPTAPKLPGSPSPPKPPGAPSAPKPPSPPLPPGAGPKPPSPPSPPKPPAAPSAPSAPTPPAAKPTHPPLPPGFKLPKPPGA